MHRMKNRRGILAPYSAVRMDASRAAAGVANVIAGDTAGLPVDSANRIFTHPGWPHDTGPPARRSWRMT
jgi:hypothetical protein